MGQLEHSAMSVGNAAQREKTLSSGQMHLPANEATGYRLHISVHCAANPAPGTLHAKHLPRQVVIEALREVSAEIAAPGAQRHRSENAAQ